MDEILEKFKRGKFHNCLDLLNSLPDADSIIENLIIENSKLICEAFITKSENDPDKIYEMQEELYLFYDKVTSLGSVNESNYSKLKLVATYNFIYWLLFYNDDEISEYELQEYLDIVGDAIAKVIDKPKSSITYSDPINKVLDNLSNLSDLSRIHDDVLLEFAVLIILYVVKVKRRLVSHCLRIVKKLTNGLKEQVKGRTAVDEFLGESSHCQILFKLSLEGIPEVLEWNQNVVDYLLLLESTFLYLLENYTESLKSLQKNTHSCLQSLWSYLVVLNASELEKWDLCLGFLIKSESLVLQTNLKARFHMMRGRVESVERNHKKAVEYFEEASRLSPMCPSAWYLLGQEHGRMGLYDFVLENFQKLIEVVTDDDLEIDVKPNFETTLLDWIHPSNEVTETEAYYALAVAYGLNESFKESAETFEKVLQWPPLEKSTKSRRLIQLPHHVTILHEAAVMNLHTGNLVRAEQIAMDAVDQYVPESSPNPPRNPLLCRDAEWLERLIYQELLETDLEPRDLAAEVIYSEDIIFVLPQDVIGMLIMSEVQRIQDVEDYKQTLSSVFSTFSRYLSKTREGGEELTLIKALAGKTCVKVASVQMKGGNVSQVDKMFKRALSCNRGDKDALHGYYTYLTRMGRHEEALKLWNTFAKEKSTIAVDSLSSFSLKYFLTDKISKRELDRIQVQVDLTDLKL